MFRKYLEAFRATPGQAESLAEGLELARNLTDPVIPQFAEPWLEVEPEAAIILYESLLRHQVGTPEIMAAELEHLLDMMNRPNVVIQVVREGAYFQGSRGSLKSLAVARSPIQW